MCMRDDRQHPAIACASGRGAAPPARAPRSRARLSTTPTTTRTGRIDSVQHRPLGRPAPVHTGRCPSVPNDHQVPTAATRTQVGTCGCFDEDPVQLWPVQPVRGGTAGWQVVENFGMDGTLNAAAADYVLLSGAFDQYRIVDRIGATVQFIPAPFSSNFRPTAQVGFHLHWRTGGDVLVADAFRLTNYSG
jgi:Phage capsid family